LAKPLDELLLVVGREFRQIGDAGHAALFK
jgi:hypothetical protein